jgi:predicted Zn-dependent peptidase
LSQVLSDGRSSRLYRSLVHEEQQALAAEGGYWELDDAGVFLAIASVRPDATIERVEELFLAEIERLKREPISEEELDKAKRQIEVGLVDGLGTNHALASRIARDYATFGRIRPLSERLAEIEAVSAEDVQRVARTYLREDQRSVIYVIPPPVEGEE